ncbi:MAG: hypothetical protein QHG99_02775 [Methanomicrobiales archaeon]|nr:hypothetical protein [Methanomicrobiales archaeon]
MFTRQERLALSLLILVTAIVFAGIAILEGIGRIPFAKSYDPGLPDGTLVLLEGRVERAAQTREGGHLLLRVNGTNVFVPSPASGGIILQGGETVRILGTLQTYRGEKEVVVEDAGDIVLISFER